MGWDLIQPFVPSVGDKVSVGVGNGVELGTFDGLVQAGIQGMQNIQDGDKGGGGSRLNSKVPGKPGCNDIHDVGWRVCSGHGKMRMMNMKSIWVWWEGDIKMSTLWVGKEVMKRGWGKSWSCQGRIGAGV